MKIMGKKFYLNGKLKFIQNNNNILLTITQWIGDQMYSYNSIIYLLFKIY